MPVPVTRTRLLLRAALVVACAACGVTLLMGAWPGWVSGDTNTMWYEATGRFAVGDRFSPHLSQFWSLLEPERLGPAIPFVIQIGTFWMGVGLTVWVMSRHSVFWAAVFLVAVVISIPTWIAAWVINDGSMVATIVFSIGVIALAADLSRRGKPRRVLAVALALVGASLVGLSASGRIYMVPVMWAWVFLMFWCVWRPRRFFWLPRVGLVLAISATFVLTVVGVVSYQRYVVSPFKMYAAGSTMFLDLARIECVDRSLSEVTPSRGLIPRSLIINGDGDDVCKNHSRFHWDYMVGYFPGPGTAFVRLPLTEGEYAELQTAWVDTVSAEWRRLLVDRAFMFMEFLRTSPEPGLLPDQAAEYERGGMGCCEVGGLYPSRGGTSLQAMAMGYTSTLGRVEALNAVWLPVLALPLLMLAVVTFYCRRFRWSFLGLCILPLVYVAAFSMVAPHVETRYVAIAEVMAMSTFVVAVITTSGLRRRVG